MSGGKEVSVQADITSIPGAALDTVSFTQGLLRAVSADNVNHNAVIQVQAIGACFQCNGPWAAKVPDLLSRTSCVRLERLSSWIGWEKNDVPAFMSRTAGGRSGALLCCALGSLYSSGQCGMALFDIGRDILPLEQQTSSPIQLGNVCMVLESKLGCLGFGNHFGLQVTRLRQCFWDAGLEIPGDLADKPTEIDMHAFLIKFRAAPLEESLILHYSGTRSSGTFLSLVLAICPEDVLVEVNGGIIMRGCRDNVIFSISSSPNSQAEIQLETKLNPHTADLHKRYIIVQSQHEFNRQLNFSFNGMLSSQLDIAFAMADANPRVSPKLVVANFIASMAMSFEGKDFYPEDPSDFSRAKMLPAQGFRIALGPMYRSIIRDRLEKVLYGPADVLQDPATEYRALKNTISAALPFSHCICGTCATGDPWNVHKHPKADTLARPQWKRCPVNKLWSAVGYVMHVALLTLFVEASPNSSMRLHPGRFIHCFGDIYCRLFRRDLYPGQFMVDIIYGDILELLGRWEAIFSEEYERQEEVPPIICSSSSTSTIYPSTLAYPTLSNPWVIQYDLVEGRLHHVSDCYDFIICAMPGKKEIKNMARSKAKSSIKQGTITESGLGEHSSLLMTLRPAIIQGRRALVLRCLIRQVNSTINVNFLDIHLGFMSLTPADGCEHNLSKPLVVSDSAYLVKATSVMEPVPAGKYEIGMTLTHRNKESQFLCCTQDIRQLYQGDCCMLCAIIQAKREGYKVVIGGIPSAYHVIDDGMAYRIAD